VDGPGCFCLPLLGFTVGALMLANKGVPLHPALWQWLPAHIEFLLFGWIVQVAMGVAFWILPRYWKRPRRGNEALVYIAFVLLNVGIWAVVLSSIWFGSRWGIFAGRLLETGAVLFFALHAWKRIVSRDG
jgi:cbb3-type cytochrome oxidase subunit 1